MDRFRPILMDKVEEEHRQEMRQEKLKADNANSQIKVSSAVGFALGSGADILEVVKTADTRMYENKKCEKGGREG